MDAQSEKLFKDQIKGEFTDNLDSTARAAGFNRIEGHLYGGPGLAHNGYYRWVAMGFDMEIPPEQLKELRAIGISGLRTVRDLIATYGEDGAYRWKEHGGSGMGWLDLDPKSETWGWHRDYLRKSGVRIK